MDDALLGPAEEPGIWTPPGAHTRLIPGDGVTVVARHDRATVERVRLAAGDVATAVAATRGLARAHGLTELVWWIGELSRPPGLVDALLGAGLIPYAEEPVLLTLTIDHAPPPVAGVEVRWVDDLATYRTALEVDWEAWDMPAGDRRVRRRAAADEWALAEASGAIEHHLALVDGRPAGFGRAVATPGAGVLMGGAVAPWARGRGAYRALVRARWDASAARGVPRLVTSAGAMSAPVLRDLGFTPVGEVRLLRDPLVTASSPERSIRSQRLP